MTIQKLNHTHLPDILALLRDSKLPSEDIDLGIQHFWGLISEDQIVGIGALEISGSSALLRSMAIDKHHQNRGLGKQVLQALVEGAKSEGIKQLYLLTETAEAFFKRNQFKVIERRCVPPEIATMEEFKSICPSSAICMTCKLDN